MHRLVAATLFVAATLGAAQAQDAAPAETPAPADVVVDPAASVDDTPKQANLLTGLYATMAVIEICDIAVEPAVQTVMEADRARLEAMFRMDEATATEAFGRVRADVETTSPDCAEGSADRQGVEAVTAVYAQQAAAAPAGTMSAPAPEAPAAQ